MEMEEDKKIKSMLFDKGVIDDNGNLIEKDPTKSIIFLFIVDSFFRIFRMNRFIESMIVKSLWFH